MNQCLLIGVDDYAFGPLSSAVNDALAVRDKLVALGLFREDEITMLASPTPQWQGQLPQGTRSATCDEILAALHSLYVAKSPPQRFLFYFAGHGISTYREPAQATLTTVLLPADVRDLAADGRKLVDFDALRTRFALRGPQVERPRFPRASS